MLSILQSTERPDFLNLSIGCIAIHFLSNREKIKKSSFRNLVLGMVVSFLFDAFWISMEWDAFTEASEDDSTEDLDLKSFTFQIALTSLLFRPIVIITFWRASIDFKQIIKHSKV